MLKKMTWSFLAGAAVGATFALLYAPMTGKKMKRRVADVADKVVDKVDDLQDVVRRISKV